MHLPKKVDIYEVGARDGLQIEKTRLSVDQKAALVESMVAAGAKSVEVGSFVHPAAVPQMADTDEVAKKLRRIPGVEYCALVMNIKGMERALAVDIRNLRFTVSATDSHSKNNQNRTPAEVIDALDGPIAFARDHGMSFTMGMPVAFGCPFEGRTSYSRVESIADQLVAKGVTAISLADTIGVADPLQVYTYMSSLLRKYPRIHWAVHLHNTRGLALANILAAMQAGIVSFSSCFAGIGGCPFAPGASGNVATEDVLFMLHSMGIETGYDLDKVIAVALQAQEWLGHDTDSFMARLHRNRKKAA